jgi:glycosyltransferase involved in cell wall biosynthesis
VKIAIFTDVFTPQFNGVTTATISLVKGLADRGHKIYIIAPKYKGIKEFAYKNVKVIRLSSVPAYFYEDFRFTGLFSFKLKKYLKNQKIDLIHFMVPMPLGLQAIFLSNLLKVPLVGTFHTFFADREYLKHAKMDFKVIQKLAWAYSRGYYNRCELITCPTEMAKKELLAHGFKQPIKAISNGIEPGIFDNSKWKSVKNKFNKNGKILLFVGRIAHEKNMLYLLDCFSLVLKKLPNTKLLIVGDGPEMDELKQGIIFRNLEDNVILTGKIERDKLVKSGIYKACDLFVTASTTETQGITTLEAQANGLVAVGINERGIKDLIKDKYNGYLARWGDKKQFANAIINLLSNNKLHETMKANTLKEIKKHYLPNIIKQWEKEYSILINSYPEVHRK